MLPRPHRIILHVGKPLVFTDKPNDRTGWESAAAAAFTQIMALAPTKP